ncbi:polyphosphate kinase 2 family protein [Kytococcus schroeteri]|uniref:polyphosphate kinase 2 family protein n=1 Tax=Kytococcus schroeteri TaxID=138300 RepID=UPI0035E9AADC
MAKKKNEVPGPSDKQLAKAAGQIQDGATPFSDALRAERGFRLSELDPRSTPAFEGDKVQGKLAMMAADAEVDELQERLWANGTRGDKRRLLVVVQGMDTSGKGGVMRHVIGAMDPQGTRIASFKKPTAEELRHDFLWRIRQQVPAPGEIGVFDRSHYEDVLVVRVHDLVPPAEWQKRYALINAFERQLAARGVTMVKVMLHVSPEEQAERLLDRLERPDKHWKFNPGDLDERDHWADYQKAYQVMLTRTSTKGAPWYVVPADRKWYARLAVQQLVLEHLRGLDLQWPEADFDVEASTARLRSQRGLAPEEGAEQDAAEVSEAPAPGTDRGAQSETLPFGSADAPGVTEVAMARPAPAKKEDEPKKAKKSGDKKAAKAEKPKKAKKAAKAGDKPAEKPAKKAKKSGDKKAAKAEKPKKAKSTKKSTRSTKKGS